VNFKEVKDGDRWLMLGEDCPDNVLELKQAIDKGKYTELICVDRAGFEYHIAVYDRDVKEVVKEYGVNSDQWGLFKIERKPGSRRGALVPIHRAPEEEKIVS